MCELLSVCVCLSPADRAVIVSPTESKICPCDPTRSAARPLEVRGDDRELEEEEEEFDCT